MKQRQSYHTYLRAHLKFGKFREHGRQMFDHVRHEHRVGQVLEGGAITSASQVTCAVAGEHVVRNWRRYVGVVGVATDGRPTGECGQNAWNRKLFS